MILTLEKVEDETLGVKSFFFKPQSPIDWIAGQFLHYTLHHEPTDDRGSDRWFTIASAPYEGHIMVTTRFASEKGSTFKKALKDLKPGETIEAEGPEGDFTVSDPGKDYVFIAGGIGITPFRSILLDLDHRNKPISVTLLYANRDENIVYKDELEVLAKKPSNFKIHYILSPKHVDGQTIRSLISDIRHPIFFVSGPEPMVESMGNTLKEMGIAEDHIKQDFFPGYPEE